jgi:hypothetical protein
MVLSPIIKTIIRIIVRITAVGGAIARVWGQQEAILVVARNAGEIRNVDDERLAASHTESHAISLARGCSPHRPKYAVLRGFPAFDNQRIKASNHLNLTRLTAEGGLEGFTSQTLTHSTA